MQEEPHGGNLTMAVANPPSLICHRDGDLSGVNNKYHGMRCIKIRVSVFVKEPKRTETMKSAWPWMKDVDIPGGGLFADPPTAPLNSKDKRPAIADIIEDNRQKIYEVKRELKKDPLYNSRKHDDLFIVRFLLSHNRKSKKAAEAAKRSIAYRAKYKIDTELGDIRYHAPHDINQVKSEALKRYLQYFADDAIRFVVPDQQRGVIGILKFDGFDQHLLVKNVSEEDWIPSFSYFTEYSFQWLDYVSRITGRLTKSIRIVDTNGMTLKKVNNEMNKRDGTAMKYMEDYYPQLLEKVYICNPPQWIHIPWKLIRTIFPKRLTAKIDFVNPLHTKHERQQLYEHISEENLPVQFGGTNKIWPVEFPLNK